MNNIPLVLLVRSRDQILFNGPIKRLSSKNEKGLFDILPFHSNFISLLQDKLFIELSDGHIQEIVVEAGIARVIENQIEVYIGVKH